MQLLQKLFNRVVKILTATHLEKQALYPGDFDRLRYEILPCDVLLVSGTSHVSEVIKIITQSHWSHAALYIGRLHDIESKTHRQMILDHCQCEPDEQLVLESLMGRGTIITPLKFYQHHHTRICRPDGLLREDGQKVIAYTIEHLGKEYDVRQVLDLARFMFPWNLFPRRWRSSLFSHNVGSPTREVCSTLIAEAFSSVSFPILPIISKEKDKDIEFIHFNPRLYTPSHFDFSPYFKIIKYPLVRLGDNSIYSRIPWNKEVFYSHSKKDDKITIHALNPRSSSEEKNIGDNVQINGSISSVQKDTKTIDVDPTSSKQNKESQNNL